MSPLEQTLSAAGLDLEDLTIAWREACHDLRGAYRAWCLAGRAAGSDGFAAYLAAADREAAAADVLARYAVGDRQPHDPDGPGLADRRVSTDADATGLQAIRKRSRRHS